VYDLAGPRVLGISGRGHDHRDGRAGAPLQRVVIGQPAGRGGVQQPGQRSDQQRQHHLGLRVTEARVELDHPDPARGQGQAGVEQTGERRAPTPQFVDSWLQYRGHDVGNEMWWSPRQWGVGPHAASIAAGVPVTDSLEILGRLQGEDRRAVGHREQRHLGAVEIVLDDDAVPAGEDRSAVVGGSLPILGHENAFAGREAVVLDDVRRAEPVQSGLQVGCRRHGHGFGRGYSGGDHHLFGEGLRPLQCSGFSGRSETGDASGPYGVGCSGDEGNLGADDNQIGRPMPRCSGDLFRRPHPLDHLVADLSHAAGTGTVEGVRRGGQLRGAGVSRGAGQRRHRRVVGQRETQRMLAAA